MGYKYEDEIKEELEFTDLDNTDNQDEMLNELQEVYSKAKAFEEIKKHVDKEVDFYMALYRETKDPTYSSLNSHYDALLGYIEELEQEYDER